jgi:Holliday junction resolvasome RuvABC ATP-dependent DNA helicase subunit
MTQLAPFLVSEKRMPNTLMYGEPGLGKTQLARKIAFERNDEFEELLCPVKAADVPDFGIVLLDEVHKQTNPEPLFPLMEEGNVTVLGATTRPEKLESAFKSRFFLQMHLERYLPEEIQKIITATAENEITEEQAVALSHAAAGNPRQAERLVETGDRLGTYDPETVLSAARIDGNGLTDLHMKYLEIGLATRRPVGIAQMATMLYLDEQTTREIERYLIEMGLVELLSNGRTLTRDGRAYATALER